VIDAAVPDYRINNAPPTAEQLDVLRETRDTLVVGRPGSGKTSVALLKALRFLDSAGEDTQVLFLSFSNAAVQRIRTASGLVVSRAVAARLRVTTFHAFCFDVLRSHSRLVGLPGLGAVVLPHERRIVLAEAGGSTDVLASLERDGRLTFDRFLPLTLRLFRKHPALCRAYAAAYPLILVDEYQDTNDEQDEMLDMMAGSGQVVYLGDPDQRVYDFVEGVRADRFERLVARRGVRRIDLPGTSHRSGASDLVGYGRAILSGAALVARPSDVRVWRHGSGADSRKKLRLAISTAENAVRVRTDGRVQRPASAVLARTNAFAMRLSEDLRSAAAGFQPFWHRLHAEMPDMVPAWSLVLRMLECRGDGDATGLVADAIEGLSRFEAAVGTLSRKTRARGLMEAAQALRTGKRVRTRSLAGLAARVGELARLFTGDPKRDVAGLIKALGEVGGAYFDDAVRAATLCGPAESGPLLKQLGEAFAVNGCYKGACQLGEAFLARERLFETEHGTGGRVVTTLHKTKGKEFDAVIIVDGAAGADKLVQSDDPQLEKSRRLLSMAIARARYHVAIVTPVYDQCILLPSHPQ
jgi:DNA helicase-2/ATP-dependent DNA helicase PcrA